MSTALKILIGFSVSIVIIFAACVGYVFMIADTLGGADKNHTRQELVSSYAKYRQAIQGVIRHYSTMVPAGKQVEVEFEYGDIQRIVVQEGPKQNPTYSLAWASTSKLQLDSLVVSLGWSEAAIQQLQEKLEAADCIAIQNGEPAVLGFKRSGMGMYSFNVFSKPISNSLREQYARGCTHIIQSDELVLEYGGGAIGPQCFPANY
ncbi:hypothetical protein [Hymenobacter swuensis]|uniref:Uncharacterized protein n=1 Tax=Hymenobacter swuensis DY53 TaxID=1227739 RepID=W8F4H2_9BACT|nr:hypothetical protein [Hymenobacter swuensis]AHJ96670.1 hypothetical protein Hsw_1075 [Hymenobacter swuensis DY53]